VRRPKRPIRKTGSPQRARCERSIPTNAHLTYTITLSWNEEEGAYIGQAQELVGIKGTGNTYEDALASLLEAIRWWREQRGEGSSSPVSPMLMVDPDAGDPEEPPEIG
jgi:predicted RNase H-like HicB family nuclease